MPSNGESNFATPPPPPACVESLPRCNGLGKCITVTGRQIEYLCTTSNHEYRLPVPKPANRGRNPRHNRPGCYTRWPSTVCQGISTTAKATGSVSPSPPGGGHDGDGRHPSRQLAPSHRSQSLDPPTPSFRPDAILLLPSLPFLYQSFPIIRASTFPVYRPDELIPIPPFRPSPWPLGSKQEVEIFPL